MVQWVIGTVLGGEGPEVKFLVEICSQQGRIRAFLSCGSGIAPFFATKCQIMEKRIDLLLCDIGIGFEIALGRKPVIGIQSLFPAGRHEMVQRVAGTGLF